MMKPSSMMMSSSSGWGHASLTLILVALLGLASVGVQAEIPVCILLPQDNAEYRMIAAAAALAVRHGAARNPVVSVDYVAALPATMPNLVPLQMVVDDSEILNTTSTALKCVERGGVVIVGPGSSATSHAVASSGQALGVAQVDHWASGSFLSNPSTYKYLSRTYPSDAAFAVKLMELCEKWKWVKLAVIHRDHTWGKGVRDDVRAAGVEKGVQVLSHEVPFTQPVKATIKQELVSLRDQGVRIFVVAHYSDVADVLLAAADEAGMIGEGYGWITCDTWGDDAMNSNAVTSERVRRAAMVRLRPGTTSSSAAFVALDTALRSANASFVNLTAAGAAGVVGDGATWHDVHPLAAYAYDAAMMAVIGVAKAHAEGVALSPPAANLASRVHDLIIASANATNGTNILSASGNVSFDAIGDRSGIPFLMDQFKLVVGAGANRSAWTTVPRAEALDASGLPDNDTLTWAGGKKTPPTDPAYCKNGYQYDAVTFQCGLKLAILVPSTYSENFMQVAAVANMAVHHVNTLDSTVVGADVVARLSAGPGPALHFTSGIIDTKYLASTALKKVVSSLKTADLAAMIGAARSATSQPLANLGAAVGIPQISYWSTSGELKDKSSYPYFARTIPSDDTVVLPLIGFFRHLGVFHIGVLYLGDSYGTGLLNFFREALIRHEWADGKIFDIRGVASFEFGDYAAAENGLKSLKKAGIKVFYIICLSMDVEHIMESAEKLGMIKRGYYFVFPEALSDHIFDSAVNPTALQRRLAGVVSVKSIGFKDPTLSAGSKSKALHTAYRSMAADPVVGPRVFPSNANLTKVASETGVLYDVSGYVYDAVFLMALAVKRAMTRHPASFDTVATGKPWAGVVMESMTGWNGTHEVSDADGKMNFTGVSGVVQLDKNGDRIDLPVLLYQVQGSSLEFVGNVKTVADADKKLSGVVTLEKELIFMGNTTSVSDGFTCPQGSMYNESVGCVPCQPGEFLNQTTNACEACPAGTFTSLPSALQCSSCTSLADSLRLWQNETGATACNFCPEGTSRPGNRPGLSLSECVCNPGTYQADLATNGSACVSCIEGGTCPGANLDTAENLKPYPSQGFWGDPAHPTAFTECPMLEKQCKGGEKFECSEGYEGEICHACAEDFYLQVGECKKCLEDSTSQFLLMVFTTICIFALWFGMNKFTAGQFDPADIGLQFMQISDIIGNFSLQWSTRAIETWQTASAIVNFDVDIVVMWQCFMPWSYTHGFVLSMTLSFIQISVSLAWYGLRRLCLRWVKQGYLSKAPLGFLELSDEDIPATEDEIVMEFVSFYVITYNALCAKCFSVFIADDAPNGSSYLMASPDLVMYSSKGHKVLLALGIFGLFAYVIGVPLFIWTVLVRAKRADMLADETFLRRFGWLYKRYEAEWYFWELIIMLRRFFMTAVLIFASKYGLLQAMLGCLIMSFFLALQFYARPFRDEGIDVLESLACAVNILYILSGVLGMHSEIMMHRLVFDYATIFCFLAIVFWIVYLLLKDYASQKAVEESRGKVAERVAAFILGDNTNTESPSASPLSPMDKALNFIPGMNRLASSWSLAKEGRSSTKVDKIMALSISVYKLCDVHKNMAVTIDGLKHGLVAIAKACHIDALSAVIHDDEHVVQIAKRMNPNISRDKNSEGISLSQFLAFIVREMLSEVQDPSTPDGLKKENSGEEDLARAPRLRSMLSSVGLDKKKPKVTQFIIAIGELCEESEHRIPQISIKHERRIREEVDAGYPSCDANSLRAAHSLIVEIPDMVEPQGMLAYICRGTTKSEILRLLRIEARMSTFLADTGTFSAYRHNTLALTWRNICHVNPSMVEFLADPTMSSDEDCQTIARMIEFSAAAYDAGGKWHTPVSDAVQELDLAPVAAWLVTQPENKREDLFKVLKGVADARKERLSSNELVVMVNALLGLGGGRAQGLGPDGGRLAVAEAEEESARTLEQYASEKRRGVSHLEDVEEDVEMGGGDGDGGGGLTVLVESPNSKGVSGPDDDASFGVDASLRVGDE